MFQSKIDLDCQPLGLGVCAVSMVSIHRRSVVTNVVLADSDVASSQVSVVLCVWVRRKAFRAVYVCSCAPLFAMSKASRFEPVETETTQLTDPRHSVGLRAQCHIRV